MQRTVRTGSAVAMLGMMAFLWGAGGGCGLKTAASGTSPDPAAPSSAAASGTAGLFADVAVESGIGGFTLGHGGRTPLTILETLGNGCGLFDYDNDGWLDVLLLGPEKVALYRNNGKGGFEDKTTGSGLRQAGTVWQGVATGDYDNDGKTDLFLSGYRDGALYHNEGGGRFREVTRQAGVASKLWGASACFVDVDHDGLLDLYVTHYVKFFPDSIKFCLQGGLMSTCGPSNYDPEKGTLYRNRGDGTFADETEKRGLADAHGNALGVAIADYDGDGDIDIAVANDQLPGDLYRNNGKGFFRNVGLESGTAYDVTGSAHAGMGIDWADYQADGSLALVVTTYQHQPTSLYAQTGPGLFADVCYTAGIGQATVNTVGFGVKFFDYDNDGLPDVLIANGHAVDNIAQTDKTTTYRQRPQLLHNRGGGTFEEVAAAVAGPAFARDLVGRGLAVGDIDNDGWVDALILDIEGRPVLLRNRAADGAAVGKNHWLSLRLIGTNSNRDALGAQITITAGGRKRRQVVSTTGSFMSANDVRAHIGLGTAKAADRIEIRWPSGARTVLNDVAADRFLTVTEGQGITRTAAAAKDGR